MKPFDRRRRSISSIVVLVFVVVLTLGVFNAIVLPGCGSCHGEDDEFLAATGASAHSSVDCRACHVPEPAFDRLAFSLHQTFRMLIPIAGGSSRDAATVPDSRCLACHEGVRSAPVRSSGIRISHDSCAAGASCSDCHSSTAHGTATSWIRVYDMDRCLACHVSAAQTECDVCHEGRTPEDRVRSRTFAVTHGPDWRATHGMGDAATCSVCHEADDCVECHGNGLPHAAGFLDVHADYAAGKGAKCAGCHSEGFCDGCHGMPMPHPARFTSGHPEKASAQRRMCERCHSESDCKTCHLKHVHPGGAVGGVPAARGGGGR